MNLELQVLGLSTLLAAPASGPARLIRGPVDIALPPLEGQCLATLDLIVGVDGSVEHVRSLYGSLPLTDRLAEAVTDWVFQPAMAEGEPYASHVLVVGLFRPLDMQDAGPCGPPDRVARAPPSLPVPAIVSAAGYPPRADGGVATVEVEIDPSGQVQEARVVGAPRPLAATAAQAARAWRFRPGHQRVPTLAYLIFGFQEASRGRAPERRIRTQETGTSAGSGRAAERRISREERRR